MQNLELNQQTIETLKKGSLSIVRASMLNDLINKVDKTNLSNPNGFKIPCRFSNETKDTNNQSSDEEEEDIFSLLATTRNS
jgi:hypothetical protein